MVLPEHRLSDPRGPLQDVGGSYELRLGRLKLPDGAVPISLSALRAQYDPRKNLNLRGVESCNASPIWL